MGLTLLSGGVADSVEGSRLGRSRTREGQDLRGQTQRVKSGKQIINPEVWLWTTGGGPGRSVTSGRADMDSAAGVPTTGKAKVRNPRQVTFRNSDKLLPVETSASWEASELIHVR